MVGIDVIQNLVFDGKGRWKKGKLYCSEQGTFLDVAAWLEKGKLKVRGSLGIFSRTMTMKPVPAR